MSEITEFYYKQKRIRFINDADGFSGFAFCDICKILSFQNITDASHYVNDNEMKKTVISHPFNVTYLLLITEAGLDMFLTRTRKEHAPTLHAWMKMHIFPKTRKFIKKNNTPVLAGTNERDCDCSSAGSKKVTEKETVGKQVKNVSPKTINIKTFEAQLAGAMCLIEAVKYSDEEKIAMFRSIHEVNNVPVDAFKIKKLVGIESVEEVDLIKKIDSKKKNEKELFNVTTLLKKNGCKLSAVKFNQMMVLSGLMKRQVRVAKTTGEIIPFNTLIGNGLKYGENIKNQQYKGCPHPKYYEDSFMDLYTLVTEKFFRLLNAA